MIRILIPIDGTEPSLAAVHHVLALVGAGLKARFVLANVQEGANLYELVTAHDPEVLQRVADGAGRDLLKPALGLRPPVLTKNAQIDQFLFEHRIGFCGHYASAAAYLFRAAGIPARVLGGYQGGSWQSSGDYLQVLQKDAHAWVEYLDDSGNWQRLDPTAAVAPPSPSGRPSRSRPLPPCSSSTWA